MLDETLKQQLKSYLDNILEPIVLQGSLDDSSSAIEMKELLEDIASLSDKVSFNQNGTSEHRPSFEVINPNKTIKIEFSAIPLGHELNSFVLAMLQVGGHPLKIGENLIQTIKNINTKCDFISYISLSCQNCPDVVQALNVMAVINPNISHRIVDGAIFTPEVESKNILAVPTVHLNGQEFGQGRMSLEEILDKMGVIDNDAINKELSNKSKYDVLVIGGGPAGAAGAIYSARKGIKTGIVAEKIGGQVLETADIENFISIKKTQGLKLAASLEDHMKDYEIDIISGQKVATVVENEKGFKVDLESGASLNAKTLILATGARWRKLGVAGEEEYLKKGIAFCPHCDGPLFKGKDVAVIGAGNSGVEAAIDLAGIVNHVTVLEFADSSKADKVLQEKLASLDNVTLITSAQVFEVLGDGNKVTGIKYKNRLDDSENQIDLNGIFVQIGLVPNSEWIKDLVELNKMGEIIINDKCQTSKPGILAAGDVTTVPYKQIIIAMGEGAKASLSAFDYLIRN